MTAPDPKAAARAIDALRRGWPVRVHGGDGALLLRAVETLAADAVPGDLLIGASRAATLKLINQRAAADIALPVRIAAPADWSVPLAHAIADPTLDLATPLKGPFRAVPTGADGAAAAAMDLARHAALLPAFVIGDPDAAAEAEATAVDVAAYADATRLAIAARARLPVSAASDAEIVAFRSDADRTDHVALIVGKRDASVPLVRIHSECLTGDVFGSLKCDCGPQLDDALARMAEAGGRADGNGWGILLYLRQEGRGIGLVNKLRAYMLQDQGYDTVDANIRLGFAVDARDFGTAAAMLRLLCVDKVRLLTNNPAKVAGLKKQGIAVAERVPTALALNPHNQRYLATKRDRTGHQL